MRARGVTLALTLFIGGAMYAAQAPRDVVTAPKAGTGVMSGSIVSDETEPTPVRRARITLNPDGGNGWTTVSDDEGRFTFARLPAGRYVLKALKEGYVGVAFGARRVGGAGTPIPVGDGQQVMGITLRMPRGAVITGVVRDERGRPLPTTGVDVLRREVRNGMRMIVPFLTSQGTDDRGVYRIYGLPAGDYLVRANRVAAGIRQVSTVDVQRIRAGQLPRPEGTAPAGQAPPTTPSRGYVPVYYPGTPDPLAASWVTLAAGEERSGVDIALVLVPNARLQGALTGPADLNLTTASVTLYPFLDQSLTATGTGSSTRLAIDAQGRYAAPALASGTYVITAAVNGPVVRPDTPGAQSTGGGRGMAAQTIAGVWVASETFIVQGADLDVNLTLRPAARLSARVVFEGTSAPPSSLSGFRLTLKPVDTPTSDALSVAQPDGTLLASGLRPGRYALVPAVPPGSPWQIRSATHGEKDVLDAPVTIDASEEAVNVTVTFTDVVTEFTGTLQDATGLAATDYFVVVYPRDRSRWTPNSRWITAVRPGTDGRFVAKGLPAGDYFVGAVTDAEPGEWFLPEFLEALVKASAPIALTPGRITVQDLKIG